MSTTYFYEHEQMILAFSMSLYVDDVKSTQLRVRFIEDIWQALPGYISEAEV